MTIVVMGVSGAGKTTIGRLLAERLGWSFVEGDDFHPLENVAKMRAGIPLDDRDRLPWLDALAARIREAEAAGESIVLACSALRRVHRERLIVEGAALRFVHLRAAPEVIRERLQSRRGHFMPAALLQSQLDTFEPPAPSENVITVDANGAPAAIVAEILRRLGM